MNIVLVDPEIPQNTGNIGRLAVATRSVLYLVGKLGFSLDEKEVRRAGLDYWKDLTLFYCDHLNDILNRVPDSQLFFFSKRATQNYLDAHFAPGSYLIFGNESVGLPRSLQKTYPKRFFKIPLLGPVRSLNLANSVAIAVYEALRKQGRI
jgi:tRNA (cytidine/uridine-2'-O-)-methyltransferase